MAAKDAFANYCAELLSALGTARVRRMFGGHGIYVDDLFVAIVLGETLAKMR
jgi:DNA transformation protein